MTSNTQSRTRAAEQARQLAARKEQERRRKVLRVGALVVGALVVAIAIAVAVSLGGGEDDTTAGPVVVPAGATADGRVAVGDADAPVTVSVFFDYMCPFCGRFEAANSAELDRLVAAGQARIDLRPLSFLDAQSEGTRFSTRTANALATVADGAPEVVWDFHQALFAKQPVEGTKGLTDAELADIARDAGVPGAVVDRFAAEEFTGWVDDVTKKAFDSGITGTPTVLVDGHVFSGDLYSPGPLTQAVEAAAAGR